MLDAAPFAVFRIGAHQLVRVKYDREAGPDDGAAGAVDLGYGGDSTPVTSIKSGICILAATMKQKSSIPQDQRPASPILTNCAFSSGVK
jgi:hypothetical protein